MRAGLPYAEPDGFCEALAEEFDADVHDYAEVKERVIGHRKGSRIKAKAKKEMLELTRSSLDAGTSVVYKSLLNRLHQREQIRELAYSVGAIPVLLVAHMNVGEIWQRLEASYANGDDQRKTFEEAGEAVLMAKGDIEWPKHELSLHFNGSHPVPRILNRVDRFLEEFEPELMAQVGLRPLEAS